MIEKENELGKQVWTNGSYYVWKWNEGPFSNELLRRESLYSLHSTSQGRLADFDDMPTPEQIRAVIVAHRLTGRRGSI